MRRREIGPNVARYTVSRPAPLAALADHLRTGAPLAALAVVALPEILARVAGVAA